MALILTQCFPPVVGGIEDFMGNLATTLTEKKIEVRIFADTHSTRIDNRLEKTLPYQLRQFGGIKPWRRWYKAKIARRYINQRPNDLIFCDSWKSLEHLNLSSPTKLTVFAHGSEYPKNPSTRKKKRILNALAKAPHIIAVSEATRQRMADIGIDINCVQVWSPPVRVVKASADDCQYASRCWQQQTPRLLSVGRLTKRKGLDMAIGAVSQLLRTYPNLRFVIVGEGTQKNTLQSLVTQHQLNQQVIFTGRVSDGEKSALYDSADIFLLPGRAIGNDIEGFGIVFGEAAYHGLPAIAGQVGGMSEAVLDGITGYLCEGRCINSIKQSIHHLLSQDTLRKQMGDNAKNRARQHIWSIRIESLLALINA